MKLGKLHQWWIAKLAAENQGELFISTRDYAGTPYGKALGTLIRNKKIEIKMSFEDGLTLLKLTR